MQTDGKNKDPDTLPGCPWAINSAEHNYCFWNFAAQLDEPVADREICNLLGINQQMLEKTLESALAKLAKLRGTDTMNGFMEAVAESLSQQDPDHTVYLPDSYARSPEEVLKDQPSTTEEEDEDAKLVDEPKKKPRRGYGMPVHRGGDKVDLFGLYSRKKLEEVRKAKKK
jgi:hypothetical protein